jgi:HD-GYP domain-containing protein (c-di-GMP phosphodiesterase class II)
VTAQIATEFAALLAFPASETRIFVTSALLHDIGKIFVPRRILLKPGALNAEETAVMIDHVVLGERYIGHHDEMQRVAGIVGQHHERMDGSGYPKGLVGRELDPLARALSVIDAFSAMTEDRPYQAGRSIEEAMMELKRCASSQFDAFFVEAFSEIDTAHWGLQHSA